MEAWEREEIDKLFSVEGGWVDDPADPGGPTNRGITIPTLAEFLRRPEPTEARGSLARWRWWLNAHPDLKTILQDMTSDKAREIYLELFIRRPRFNEIPAPYALVRSLAIDCGVLHGVKNGIRILQRAAKTKDDGILGTLSLFSISRRDPLKLYLDQLAERAAFFGRLISDDLTDRDRDGIPDNTEFAAGWLKNRLADWIRRAVA